MIRPASLVVSLAVVLGVAGSSQAQRIAARRVAPHYVARGYGYVAPGYGYGGYNPAFAYAPRGYNTYRGNRYAYNAYRGYAAPGTVNNLNGLAGMIRRSTGNGRWR